MYQITIQTYLKINSTNLYKTKIMNKASIKDK